MELVHSNYEFLHYFSLCRHGSLGKECLSDSELSKLKVVNSKDMSRVPHEIEFIKFLLGCSLVFETIILVPCIYDTKYLLEILVERASKTNIDFIFKK
ncbi:hypothetical protein MTR_5g007750 [Medicago truncatula]|uniref:FBD domain-containing protein n=1 Tax=Medicago truncatula TaxID=3880 RepID=G7K6H4_MEDTR|nr:hypothetical protein MTR_5g007750 [Medicago truncatula]